MWDTGKQVEYVRGLLDRFCSILTYNYILSMGGYSLAFERDLLDRFCSILMYNYMGGYSLAFENKKKLTQRNGLCGCHENSLDRSA